jgi:hypothetical protein
VASFESSDVKVTLTYEELQVIKRALKLVNPYGDCDDWDAAGSLLADLEN